MATDGVGIALGAEYRREALKLETSRDFQINDLYGQGGATLPVPLSSFDVKEFYGEIRVPLVQDAAFAKLLQFEGGYRHSDYSSVGGTDAWKLAGDWQPVDDIRLRASYQRAVRAPTVLESFSPNNNVLFGFNDPCGSAKALTLAQCQNTGVSAAQYGTARSSIARPRSARTSSAATPTCRRKPRPPRRSAWSSPRPSSAASTPRSTISTSRWTS